MAPRIRKTLLGVLALLLIFATSGSAMAKQNVLVELFYNSVWNDHTADVYTRDQIVINHGAGNEQQGVIPSDASLTFKNRDGRMNPENRKSTLFGLIGHNTPIRITLDDTDIRFSGQVVSWQPRRAPETLSSTRGDAWVHVKAQGTIRRLGQGTPPVESALYRAAQQDLTDLVAYYPLEEGSGLSNVVDGKTATVAGAPLDFAMEGPAGSRKTARFFIQDDREPVTQLRAPVAGTANGWTVGFWFRALPGPESGIFSTPVVDFAEIETTNSTIRYWMLEALSNPGASQFEVTAYAYDSARELITPVVKAQVLTEIIDGDWHMITLNASGEADPFMTLTVDDDTANQGTVTASGYTNSPVTAVYLPKRIDPANVADLSMAHVGVWEDSGSLVPAGSDAGIVDRWDTGLGYPGERAGVRFTRICTEEGILATVVTDSADTQPMGPQHPDTVLNLLAEIARTDAGIIHDTRDALGLTFRTGRSLYNQ